MLCFVSAAQDYCATKWSTLKQRLDNKLFSQHADISRVRSVHSFMHSHAHNPCAKGPLLFQWLFFIYLSRASTEKFQSAAPPPVSHFTSSLPSPRYQCFKSAWMYEVLHSGFRFPIDYSDLRTAQLVYDKEVQWTLGAILYKTRFLPLRWAADTQSHTPAKNLT